MARHHRRKRVARPSLASPPLAAVVAVALLTRGSAVLASAERRDDPSRREAGTRKEIPRGGGGRRRRTRADAGGGRVNLLVKYKDGPAHARSLGDYESNDGALNNWQAHTMSISTISEESHIAAVEIDANEVDFVMEEMMADEDVELVEEDFPMYKYPYHSLRGSDSSESDLPLHLRDGHRRLAQQQNRTLMETQEYGIGQIQASAVWALLESEPDKYPNTPVKVCIVDTGYDADHEDLPSAGVTGTDCGYGDPLQDGDGHGTHCAGVIGAIGGNGKGMVGVNPDPTKFSFHISKALNDDGMGTATSVLKGIKGCISSGSKIISMSLGGGPNSPIFQELYKEAYDGGVLVFAAAGNQGAMQDDYPASYPLVVSVGAADRDRRRAGFSNWNDQLELMGPGENVFSTFPGDGYGMLSGTSMATPYVAGVAALVWGRFPQCSNQQVRNVLAATAASMAAGGKGCDTRTGFGLVQARDAFELLDAGGCAAGGVDPRPRSEGGVGGCGQPLADASKLDPASFPGDGCRKLALEMLTDDYAYETSWELRWANNGVVLKKGPSGNKNFKDGTEYREPASDCLEAGTYEFIIKDFYGDGFTAPAYYTISLDGKTLATNSNFGRKETTRFTIENPPQMTPRQPEWTSLLYEDFSDGFGKFNDGGSDVMHVNSKFGRSGMVMLKRGTTDFDQSSVYSNFVPLNNRGFRRFRVAFSFYASGMEANDRFCLDYAADGAATWRRARCWTAGVDFESGEWKQGAAEFRPSAGVAPRDVRIRLRGFSSDNFDRVFVDEIRLYGRRELTRR